MRGGDECGGVREKVVRRRLCRMSREQDNREEPHHALTGVEFPRYGARNAARTSAARVAACMYVATCSAP
jgi:hypothetical protein